MKTLKDISPIMRFENEHPQECKYHNPLGFFVRQTIGVGCSLNPYEDSVRDKIYSLMEHYGYYSIVGSDVAIKMRKQMYALICLYYKWYKENY